MRRALFTCVFLLPALVLALEPMPFQDLTEETRFRALVEELRCMVCQNQNLADSDAALAKDLRREVFDLMRQGMTDVEIRAYLVDRYSAFVLYRPPMQATTLLLWFGPMLVLLGGAIAVVVIVRRRAQALTTLLSAPPARGDTQDREEMW